MIDSATDTPSKPNLEASLDLDERSDSAVYSWAAHLRFWLTIFVGLGVDLWTKDWADAALKGQPAKDLIPNVLSLQYSTNRGALFGMGQHLTGLFIAASILALVFVLYVFVKSTRGQRSFHIALGMILGGALGNLYDRLFHGGAVRDFIKIELKFGSIELWPWVFNVADMLLVCGVSVLMLNIWFGPKQSRNSPGEQPEAAT